MVAPCGAYCAKNKGVCHKIEQDLRVGHTATKVQHLLIGPLFAITNTKNTNSKVRSNPRGT